MTPDFSIIIPTRDRPSQLTRCLQALTALRYPTEAYEIIVVDDGSSVPLDSVVHPFRSRLPLNLVRQAPAGPAAARNRGAELARGRFLAFTDDDCAPAPEWLDELAAAFRETPDEVIGGRTENALPGNLFSTASQCLLDYLYRHFNRDSASAAFVASCNLALPAALYASIQGFRASYPRAAAEDRDLCDRLLAAGSRIRYLPKALVYHSHALGGRTFWRQHFDYGRGAFRFHRDRRLRSGRRLRMEPPAFYARMLGHPFRAGGIRQPVAVAALLGYSQLANAAGFLWEAVFASARRHLSAN